MIIEWPNCPDVRRAARALIKVADRRGISVEALVQELEPQAIQIARLAAKHDLSLEAAADLAGLPRLGKPER